MGKIHVILKGFDKIPRVQPNTIIQYSGRFEDFSTLKFQ